MRFQKILIGLICLLFSLSLFLPTDSNAIPAFARRYKISCTTCHAPFPKLKPYGDEFAGNGFIMIENEKERDYVTAGDDLLWLNKEFPVAIRFDAFALYDQDKTVDKDLQTPFGLKLLSGGTLYKNIGYYFYFYMYEAGQVAGIEDAYIHFNDMFKTPLDVMVGQFQVCDPLMKRELRLTYEDYEIFKVKVGDSRTNLTYDRGLMFTYGISKTSTDLFAMVVNGNGKKPASEEYLKFDDDKFKNFALRVSQGVGKYLSVGGFYYQGKEKVLVGEEVGKIENEVSYYGPDVNVAAGPIGLTAQYLIRKDTNPLFAENATEYETKGIVAEVMISPFLDRSRYYFTGLYNNIDSDQEDLKYQTATISVNYLLVRNLRLNAEFTRDLERDSNRFGIGMVTAF
jgi:hypothetical protein